MFYKFTAVKLDARSVSLARLFMDKCHPFIISCVSCTWGWNSKAQVYNTQRSTEGWAGAAPDLRCAIYNMCTKTNSTVCVCVVFHCIYCVVTLVFYVVLGIKRQAAIRVSKFPRAIIAWVNSCHTRHDVRGKRSQRSSVSLLTISPLLSKEKRIYTGTGY